MKATLNMYHTECGSGGYRVELEDGSYFDIECYYGADVKCSSCPVIYECLPNIVHRTTMEGAAKMLLNDSSLDFEPDDIEWLEEVLD